MTESTRTHQRCTWLGDNFKVEFKGCVKLLHKLCNKYLLVAGFKPTTFRSCEWLRKVGRKGRVYTTSHPLMGSHHHQVTILVPDEKLEWLIWNLFCLIKNGLAFYAGPVLPPRADGSSLVATYPKSCSCLTFLNCNPLLTDLRHLHPIELPSNCLTHISVRPGKLDAGFLN